MELSYAGNSLGNYDVASEYPQRVERLRHLSIRSSLPIVKSYPEGVNTPTLQVVPAGN